jgi:hypothetical protein
MYVVITQIWIANVYSFMAQGSKVGATSQNTPPSSRYSEREMSSNGRHLCRINTNLWAFMEKSHTLDRYLGLKPKVVINDDLGHKGISLCNWCRCAVEIHSLYCMAVGI